MKKKTANLKIVDTQTKEQQEAEQIPLLPLRNYEITRSDIVERVRKIRQQFEMTRDVYNGSMYNDADIDNDLRRIGDVHFIENLAEWLNPHFADNVVDHVITAYHLGVFAGVVFTATSPSEIDKAEKGLIFISAAQPWVSKE